MHELLSLIHAFEALKMDFIFEPSQEGLDFEMKE